MAARKKWKEIKRPTKKERELVDFRKRPNLPTGTHITLYDIRGDAISPELGKAVVKHATKLVKDMNMPHVGIDVRSN